MANIKKNYLKFIHEAKINDNKEEVVHNLEPNLEIAEINQWHKEAQIIRKAIETIKSKTYQLNTSFHEIMEEKKDGKENIQNRMAHDSCFMSLSITLISVFFFHHETMLDAFSGGVSWWKKNTEMRVIDNDIKQLS